jgi:hypothetical protein
MAKKNRGQVLEAHACKPSCLGGRDQKNCGLKPALAVCEILSQKNPLQKRAGALGFIRAKIFTQFSFLTIPK